MIHSTLPHCCLFVGCLAIDYVGYAAGQTDKFQGTGVFSGIKMEREPKGPNADVVSTPASINRKTEEAVGAVKGERAKEPLQK